MYVSSKIFWHLTIISIIFTLSAAGCSQRITTAYSCAEHSGAYNVEYVGHAIGKGQLALSTVSEREEIIEGKLTLWDETGTDATFELTGPGSCEQGIVTLRFGAGDHPDSRVRILGGTATIVTPRGRVESLFGTWSATAVFKNSGVQKTLTGFFQQAPAATLTNDDSLSATERDIRNPPIPKQES